MIRNLARPLLAGVVMAGLSNGVALGSLGRDQTTSVYSIGLWATCPIRRPGNHRCAQRDR